ncbi:FCD domain-containing protein, partial [Limimaricola sp. ASW11-118]
LPLDRLVSQHRAIAAAVAAHDPDAAEAAIRTHLRGVLEDLPKIAAAQPDFFQPDAERTARGDM